MVRATTGGRKLPRSPTEALAPVIRKAWRYANLPPGRRSAGSGRTRPSDYRRGWAPKEAEAGAPRSALASV